jgi:hypothetical protein
MNIPLPKQGPKIAPIGEKPQIEVRIEDGKAVVDEAALEQIEPERRALFIEELTKLLEPKPQKYVLRGERDADRNKTPYAGYCNGSKEKTRRNNARLAQLVKSEGC